MEMTVEEVTKKTQEEQDLSRKITREVTHRSRTQRKELIKYILRAQNLPKFI
jgi:hypothetical protein